MTALIERLAWAASWRVRQRRNDRQLGELVRAVAQHETAPATRPVVLFNASTRLEGLSQNAAFSLLAGWALRLAGTPVVHFLCNAGLKPCVLGTDREKVNAQPPCQGCIAQTRKAYVGAAERWFGYFPETALEQALQGLILEQLAEFGFREMPLGKMVMPSLRWILRKNTLADDEATCSLLKHYIQSAWNVAQQFEKLVQDVNPMAVVVFNGMFYPEAAVAYVARKHGVRTISHEVALRPLTAFFTTGEATAYPIDLPESFQLSPEQDAQLDAYLNQRFQGNFSMAGVKFWPVMHPLGAEFWEKAARFKQVVPVFTNVVFDTSQGHANVLFPHMFAWLDQVLDLIRAHPETYFVIRAHPDETRPGKESRESVEEWVRENRVGEVENALFVNSRQYFSSYELIEKSKFVMVYNSTIGLEASLLHAAVLCGGKARFTQIPTVFFPASAAEYRTRAEEFLAAYKISVPPEFYRNARRFLFTQLFRTSLPMEKFIEEDGIRRGYIRFRPFDLGELTPEKSPSIKAILDGILRDGDFLLEG